MYKILIHFLVVERKKRHLGKVKEKAPTFSFYDNPKCLSAISMILLNIKKSNSKMKILEILDSYKNKINYGLLVCPHCHSTLLIRWGTYERNVIYFDIENKLLESRLLTVQRVKCKSCGKTHALLPLGIIPYKQFSTEVVAKALNEIYRGRKQHFIDAYGIDETVVNKWLLSFKRIHLPRLTTTFLNINKGIMLENIAEKPEIQMEYINRNNRCFMQIKLGIVGLRPS